jgi:hypothetical protein
VPDYVRLPDWLPRLSNYIDDVRRRPFSHGDMDCATFAAGAVGAMTGRDPAAAYRGRYVSVSEGLALLRDEGTDDHIERAIELFPMRHPSEAQTGDLAIVPQPDGGLALGVVVGARIFLVALTGLSTVDLLDARKILKV